MTVNSIPGHESHNSITSCGMISDSFTWVRYHADPAAEITFPVE
jgi:hypothetical protein